MDEYKVQLDVFEGPLDLLLYLIKKEEVDIYEVNLTRIATQFIEYVDQMRKLDLEVAGEFLVMAATLMYIKSRELLPVDQQAPVEGEDESIDPRWELIRQLVEYKKFKEMAGKFQAKEVDQEFIYRRTATPLIFSVPEEGEVKPKVSLFDLINAVNAVLKRFDTQESVENILEDRWTVSEKIQLLLQTIQEQALIKFSDLFSQASSRVEVIVTFLAVLELIRLKQLAIIQTEAFGEIEISKAPPHESTDTAPEAVPSAEQPPTSDTHGT